MEKSVANPEPAKVIARMSECVRRLFEAGLTWQALQLPIDDPKMRERLVRFWLSGGYEPTTAQSVAREIMGTNFFGIEEAIQHFGIKPTKTQLAIFAEIPFIEAELQECKDTHILAAVFTFSILDTLREAGNVWYSTEHFAKEKGRIRWHLVEKTQVLGSTSKIWDDQQVFLKDNDEVPGARIMVYIIIGHYLATGERLFEKGCVRCADIDSRGFRVHVGHFFRDKLNVVSLEDGKCCDNLGLASSRKPQSRCLPRKIF